MSFGHSDEQIDIAARYRQVLMDLRGEGDETANTIYEGNDAQSIIFWALNIHNHTWGETNFANVLKKRVVLNRLKGK